MNNKTPLAAWPFPIEPKPMAGQTPAFIKAKAALVNSIEQDRQRLLEDATRNGVSVVHVFDHDYPKGGLTVAFRKSRPNERSTNMVDCAIATCSYSDNFNRKIGTQIALNKWFTKDTVELPLASGHEDEDLNGRVKRKFMALYFQG